MLPPGKEWELIVSRGIEYTADTVKITGEPVHCTGLIDPLSGWSTRRAIFRLIFIFMLALTRFIAESHGPRGEYGR